MDKQNIYVVRRLVLNEEPIDLMAFRTRYAADVNAIDRQKRSGDIYDVIELPFIEN